MKREIGKEELANPSEWFSVRSVLGKGRNIN